MPEEPNASFMRSLCMGHIEQDMLFPFPVLPAGQRDTLQEISAALDDLLTPRAEAMRQWDAEGELPEAFLQELREFGLFGLIIPWGYVWRRYVKQPAERWR